MENAYQIGNLLTLTYKRNNFHMYFHFFLVKMLNEKTILHSKEFNFNSYEK